MHAGRSLVGFSAILLASGAAAQDGQECFSKYAKVNVCEHARRIHGDLTRALPMRLNSNVTLVMAAVAGPQLTVVANWAITKADHDQRLGSAGTFGENMAAKIQSMTDNSVCSQPVNAAFVRLGGRIQYIYRSLEGFALYSPTVTNCPRPR